MFIFQSSYEKNLKFPEFVQFVRPRDRGNLQSAKF